MTTSRVMIATARSSPKYAGVISPARIVERRLAERPKVIRLKKDRVPGRRERRSGVTTGNPNGMQKTYPGGHNGQCGALLDARPNCGGMRVERGRRHLSHGRPVLRSFGKRHEPIYVNLIFVFELPELNNIVVPCCASLGGHIWHLDS